MAESSVRQRKQGGGGGGGRQRLEVPPRDAGAEDTPGDSSTESEPPSPAVEAASAPQKPQLLVDSAEKWKSWRRRFWATWAMLFAFVVLIYLGHTVVLVFIFAAQTMMFKEIVSLGHKVSRENQLPGFRHLQWFWYVTTQYFIYTRVVRKVTPEFDSLPFSVFMSAHNSFFAFMMYCLGVVGFVLSLRTGHYKYQFGMFAWCHMAILLIVVQTSLLIANLFQGLFWLVFPALLIVNNDVWAYFFGFFWGRTPLIQLSPKKTWEGFIGASFTTLIVGFFLPRILAYWNFMVRTRARTPPQARARARGAHPPARAGVPQGRPLLRAPRLPAALRVRARALRAGARAGRCCRRAGTQLGDGEHCSDPGRWRRGRCPRLVSHTRAQFHGVIFAIFASIIAPFGGFFASGFKRAFKKKDFGDM